MKKQRTKKAREAMVDLDTGNVIMCKYGRIAGVNLFDVCDLYKVASKLMVETWLPEVMKK